MAASNEARIWGVMAASGSGKGLWVKQQLRRLHPPRLVIWDYKDEYAEFTPGRPLYRSLEPVRQAMMRAPRGPLRLRYKPKDGTPDKAFQNEFAVLCRLVQAWGNCTFVAEELSMVTTPGWAPPGWRAMTSGGRHENVHIIGVAQNPAMIDKTFLSNCTLIHVGPLREHHHRQYVARSMDIALADVTALQQFEFIERDHNTRQVLRGRVSLPAGAAPTPTPPTPTRRGGAKPGQGRAAPP